MESAGVVSLQDFVIACRFCKRIKNHWYLCDKLCLI